MARIRTIKPEFWSSEQVMSSQPLARLLFIGLWNFCDDGGNHPLAPRTIKALVFPGDDITIEKLSELLGELEGVGLTSSYTVDGKQYIHVSGWKHQKIEKKNYKYPKAPQLLDDPSPTNTPPVGDESSNGRRPLDPVRDVDVDVDVDLEGKGIDQHNSHCVGEMALAQSVPESITETPSPGELAMGDANAPCEMTLDWVPDDNILKTYALFVGMPLDAFTPEATASFKLHYDANGVLNTPKEWVSLLVRWVRTDRAKASNVRPFPKPAAIARHTLSDERNYKTGTKGNADGTFTL